MSKKSQSCTVVEMVKATQDYFLFRTIAVGEKGLRYTTGLNSKRDKEKGGLIAKSSGWMEITKRVG